MAIERRRTPEWLGFALVGCAGFATDALLYVLYARYAGLPVYLARALAFLPATGVTWALNRHFVFQTAGTLHRRRDEYARHLGVQGLGIAVNFAAFSIALEGGLGRGPAPLLPLVIGSGCAMVFNFIGARRFVFRR
jgi:putative flippase GtrA